MTDATFFDIPYQTRAADLPLPKPVSFAAPVFINDAVSPLAGETVLSLLLRRSQSDE